MANTVPAASTSAEMLLVASYKGTTRGYRGVKRWIEGIDGVSMVVYIGRVNGHIPCHLIGILITEAMRQNVEAGLARIKALGLRDPITQTYEPCSA